MNLQELYTLKKLEYNIFKWEMSEKIIRLYDEINNKFLPTVNYFYKNIGSKNIIIPKKLNIIYKSELRKSQKYILDIIQKRKSINYHCWLIFLETAWGKSHIILNIAKIYWCKTLILCHSVESLEKMKENFKEFTDYEPWVFYWKKKEIKDITITTHRSFTAANWKIDWEIFDLILHDECDINLSLPKKQNDKSSNMIKALCNSEAKALFWLTWTPYTKYLERTTLDNWNNFYELEIIFGRLIQDPNSSYNFLPKIKIYDYKDENYLRVWWTSPEEVRLAIMEDDFRIKKQLKIIKDSLINKKITLVLSDRLDELKTYQEKLNWYNTVFVDKDTKDVHDVIKSWLERDDKLILFWTYAKLGRGFDLPPIDNVCLFAPIKSPQSVIQWIWRWLRLSPWKKEVIIYIWNDLKAYKYQPYEKMKVIKNEYWADLDIEKIKIEKKWDLWINLDFNIEDL